MAGMTGGAGSVRTSGHNRTFKTTDGKLHLPGGIIFSGGHSRDAGNSNSVQVIRAGSILAPQSASPYRWEKAIIGVLAADHTADDADFTVTEKVGDELERRLNAGYTDIHFVGPPSSNGTVNVEASDTVSSVAAVSNGNRVVTMDGAVTTNYAKGSLIIPATIDVDASNDTANFMAILDDGYGFKVTDDEGDSLTTLEIGDVAISGFLDTSELSARWGHVAAEISLLTWVKAQLNSYGNWLFDDDFGG